MSEPMVIQLKGKIPSKKNSYTPRKDGKGFFKSTELKTELDRLAMQIPGWARDLKLVHPDLHFHFTYAKANWDRDNACTTLMDLMVTMGTLENDNIASSNGTTTIHPAERGEYDGVKIIIFPKVQAEEQAPRYVDRRRRRSVPGASPAGTALLVYEAAPKSSCPACGNEDHEVCQMLGHTYPITNKRPTANVEEFEDYEVQPWEA